MIEVLQRHPIAGLIAVFFTVNTAVIGCFYFLGHSIVQNAECPRYPNDPCDAAPMLAISLWAISIPISLGAAAFVTFVIYYLYIKK